LGGAFGHAFLYDGSMHDLGTLPGLNDSFASAINNAGQVVGYSWLQVLGGSSHYRAWLYDGTLHDLGAPGLSIALAINNAGTVVGGFYLPESEWHAFIYRNGHVYDLNNLLDDSSAGWSLYQATGINASGQITGWGFHNGPLSGFILDPGHDGPHR
jgi:probable HAF family extracellular repeat protein